MGKHRVENTKKRKVEEKEMWKDRQEMERPMSYDLFKKKNIEN